MNASPLRPSSRRSLNRLAGLLLAAAALAAFAPASATAVELEPIGTFAQPVHIASDPNDPNRLFVVERTGRIQLVQDGAVSTFADLTSVVVSTPGNERGLLSVAFPPDHAQSGLLYVFYTGTGGALTVAELEAEGDAVIPASRRTVLTITHPQSNHNGGQLQFGPDGYLYISTGDGGGAGDPNGNGQNLTTLLGAILRIDPRESGPSAYTAPATNPYAGTANDPVPGARDEIWSWGLRNPWRFSFDRLTGAITIGDVGQSQREEMNYRPAELGAGRGDNFGWNCREGFIAYGSPSQPCPSLDAFTDPIHEYSLAGTPCAITGGYVVRDASLGELYGRYVYADHCVGVLRSLVPGLPLATGDRSENLNVPSPTSFGEDSCGRLYVTSLSGAVNRLAGDEPANCDPDPAGPVPENVTPPAVSGSGVPGTMLTCHQGEWTLSGSYEFTWTLAGEPIALGTGPGTTGSTNPKRFRAAPEHAGSEVACQVVRTNKHGSSAPASSNAVLVPSPPSDVPENVSPPTLTGSGNAGTMLTCDQGEWTKQGSYEFAWTLDGSTLPTGTGPGTTGSTNPKRFRTAPEQVGSQVVCSVTRTNRHGASDPAESDPVTVSPRP